MDDFKRFKFENIYEIGELNIDNYPLYLNQDGLIVLVKDKSKLFREPTSEEIQLYCRPRKESFKKMQTSNSNGSCSTNESENKANKSIGNNVGSKRIFSNNFKKDKGLTITVKKTNSDQILSNEQEKQIQEVEEENKYTSNINKEKGKETIRNQIKKLKADAKNKKSEIFEVLIPDKKP